MLMEIIAYAAVVYLIFRLGIILANLMSRPVLISSLQQPAARISVLIPARDEEHNVGNLLDDLMNTDSNVIEILVYDDDSSDGTAEVVKSKAQRDARIGYTKGQGPVKGWLGKNFACHELAMMAKGDYFLFLDADVRLEKRAIPDAVEYLSKYRLSLLSLFPVQEMKTAGEWMTVPLMNKILLSNLPLSLIRKLRWKAFSAANGQFMFFRAATYKAHWFHRSLKAEKVEDLGIIRLMKKMGYRTQTLLSSGQVHCRMYQGYREALNGFAKNIVSFFGNNWLILALYILLTTLGPITVWIAWSWETAIMYLAGLALISLFSSILSRQNWLLNLILMLFQQGTLVILSIKAAWLAITGRMEWKGRRI